MKLLSNSYQYGSLDSDKQDKLYQVFYDTYMNDTGGAFTRGEFEDRAYNWIFFGVAPDTDGRQCGGIAVRMMRSGSLKLVASFGNLRGIMDGLKEMESEYGDRAIIGFMPKNLVSMLCRADPEFVEPPVPLLKVIIPILKNAGTILGVEKIYPDGSVDFSTPSGTMRKYAVCNKNELRWVLDNLYNPKLGVPKIMVAPVKKILEKILGL